MLYEPGRVPDDIDELPQFLFEELQKIVESFANVESILLVEKNVEPSKPRDGMIVLADGVNWNPGGGAGFYGRRGGAWVKLG